MTTKNVKGRKDTNNYTERDKYLKQRKTEEKKGVLEKKDDM